MNSIKKRLENFIGDTPRFTVSLENRIINEVSTLGKKKRKSKLYNQLRISLLFAIIMTVASVFVISFVSKPASNNPAKAIKDEITEPTLEFVEPGDNTFIIEYGYDNMDQGNHDFLFIDNDKKAKIVIEKVEAEHLRRGDIIYYKYPGDSVSYNPPEYYLSRIVGLPGETVEIIDGQVFINDQRLDTFYSEARRLGQNLEEWFIPDTPESSMETFNNRSEEDFMGDMKEIKIPNDSVFVLSDDWVRGTDSRFFGALKLSTIEGRVLGYLKE